uniref:SAC3 domain-containing protein 1 n=1 Tax=Aceria tosichella TaxID=561515 RepID=A0A6G1SC81_9ACAR
MGEQQPEPYTDNGYHLDIEQDYETVYKFGWRPDPFGEGTIPVGTCSSMCTYEELEERERQNRLSKFEMIPNTNPPKGDSKLAMKEYKRSAAGREFTVAMNLRPWSVLKRSLRHLLLDICLRDDDWMYISGFVFDRLKAIRQDMIIQRIEGSRCVEILEGSVRFLVYSMFRLTCTTRDYIHDRIDKAKLSPEGMPVSGLDNYEMNVVREMKLTMQCLRDCLHSLIVQYQDYVPDSPNRFIFEAINIIVNLPQLLGHQYISTCLMSKQELRDSNPMFKTIFRMRREHFIGNHYGALKHLPNLREYPLIILAYASIIPLLQINMITRFKKVYSARGSSKTHPDHLCKLICPPWLDSNYDERLIFTVYLAVQLGIFDHESLMIDFSFRNNVIQSKIEQYQLEKLAEQIESDNETRIYALQMIAARNWQFFDETLKVYGVESVLDPSQQQQ